MRLSGKYEAPENCSLTYYANHIQSVIDGEGLAPAEGILHHGEGVDLMPANIGLAGMEMGILMAMSREQLLNMWVSPLKGSYDWSGYNVLDS